MVMVLFMWGLFISVMWRSFEDTSDTFPCEFEDVLLMLSSSLFKFEITPILIMFAGGMLVIFALVVVLMAVVELLPLPMLFVYLVLFSTKL